MEEKKKKPRKFKFFLDSDKVSVKGNKPVSKEEVSEARDDWSKDNYNDLAKTAFKEFTEAKTDKERSIAKTKLGLIEKRLEKLK